MHYYKTFSSCDAEMGDCPKGKILVELATKIGSSLCVVRVNAQRLGLRPLLQPHNARP